MRLRHLARTTNAAAGEIVRDVMNAIHPDAVATMTSEANLKKQVQYARQVRGIQAHERPTHKNGWAVPDDLQNFVEDGGRFLQWDSGEDDPDRIQIYASDDSIRRLHTIEHFYSDGVMRNIPIFEQLYSIHGKLVRFKISFFYFFESILKVSVSRYFFL